MEERHVPVPRRSVRHGVPTALRDGAVDDGRGGRVEVSELERFLTDLCIGAAEAVAEVRPDAAPVSCAVTVEHEEIQVSAAWTDARAAELDEVQYQLDRGPCLHSLREHAVVLIPDIAVDTAWERWREKALEHGVGSSLAVPVPVDTGARAAFNLYSSTPGAFDDDMVELVQEHVRRAASAIELVSWIVEQERHTEQLRTALGSRSVIDQALGVVMAQNRCDAAEAFTVLRRASQNRNVRLRDVASEVVTTVTGKPPVEPPAFR